MNQLHITTVPIADTGMLIRRPIHEVFEAFADPDIITKFWFTKSSGRLEEGAKVEWTWAMYGFSIPVDVLKVEIDRRIIIEWPGEHGKSQVEWEFSALGADQTFVHVVNSGFQGSGDEVVKQAIGSTQGFSLVLAGAKAWLEHGIELNLVADRFPEGFGKE